MARSRFSLLLDLCVSVFAHGSSPETAIQNTKETFISTSIRRDAYSIPEEGLSDIQTKFDMILMVLSGVDVES